MLAVEITQFIPPNGRTAELLVDVPDDLTEQYTQIRSLGLRLTVEKLMTGIVSLCIENAEYGDFKIKLFKDRDPEGPDNIDPLIDIIREFNVEEYARWLEVSQMEEEQERIENEERETT